MNTKSCLILPFLALAMLAAPAARAAVTLTPATGGTAISADNTSSATWTTLTGPIMQEGSPGNLGTGSLVLTAPAGFQFNTAATVTVLVNGTGGTNNINHVVDGGTIPVTVTATTLTMVISTNSTGSGHQCKLTWQNIQVQPTSSSLPTGNITYTGSSSGISGGANCGTLTEVAGAATKLAFTTQPVGGTYGSNLGTQPVVKSQDQFGNNSTTGLGATVNVSLSLTTGPGALTGTTNINIGTGGGTVGVATFSGLKVNAIGTGDVMTASASGLTSAASSSFDVTAKALTVANVTASNKVYDATTNATLNTATAALSGVVAGDTVTLDTTGAVGGFATKTVANGKTVTVTGMTIGGLNAGNYTLTQPSPTANITAKSLTVTATASDKAYDGTTTATVVLADNRISGDVFTATKTSATFSSITVGTNKTVSVSGIAISGTDAANYSLTSTTASTTANITRATLTVGATASNKTYDATTNASVTLNNNKVSGDSVTVTFTSAGFVDKNVANGKTVNVGGIAITGGSDSGNYTLGNSNATTTANITTKSLTVTMTALDKAYDGTTAASVTYTDNRLAGDVFTVTNTSATFSSSSVGTGKTVTVSGISLIGTDAVNYTPSSTTATDTANINKATLTVAGVTASSKVYNGNTTATVITNGATLVGLVGSETATLGGTVTGTFADKNIGTNKTVTIAGFTITGGNSANYTLTQPTATASITVATLTVSATGTNKVYDGTTNTTVTLSDNHIGADVVTTAFGTAGFADKNIGTNKPVSVTGIAITGGSGAGNYSLGNTTASTTANITAKTLTVTATAADKVYDGTNTAVVVLADNRISGDVMTVTNTAATFSSSTAANNKTVTVSGISISGTDATNYTLASTTATDTANITKAVLTVLGVTASDKSYNGNTTATIVTTGATLVGVVPGETLTVSGSPTGTFADKNVGTNKPVTVSGVTASGTTSANYTVTQPTTTATITQATLIVSATGVNRVYNGTTNATVTLSDNHFGSDVVTTSYGAAAFADKNVANGKPVSVSGIAMTGGSGAGNYVLGNTTASTTANITKLSLTATATGVNKVYDKTTTATVTLQDNRLSGDVLTLTNTTATFSSATVGTNKTVSVSGISIVAGGADAGNYSMGNTTASTTANISVKPLTVSGVAIADKIYNGGTTATVLTNTASLAGVIAGDTVVLTGPPVGSFADKNVGNGKPVTVTGLGITGTNSTNYSLPAQPTPTGNITPASLTVTAVAASKVYDGNAATTATLSDNHIGSDSVTTAYGSAAFVDKNMGTGKTVNVTGIAITGGADAGNYTPNTATTATANITRASLTVTAAGVDKVYDGTMTGTVTLSDNRFGSDVVTTTFGSAAYADKNVGSSKPLSVTGIAVTGGADAGNYTLANTTASTAANITARSLTVSATGVDKVYDGTTNTTVTLSDNHVGSDNLTTSYTDAGFADKNADTNKPVSVNGIALTGGTDFGNYTLANTTTSTTANITPADLTVTATGVDKSYDGTTNATVTLSDNRIGTDIVTTSYGTAAFADDNVGTNKQVNVDGIAISGGADATNYTVANTSTNTTANITSLALTVTVTAANKVYDGNTSATVTLSDNHVGSDSVTVTYGTASFADKNAGSNKVVSVDGIAITGGANAANYTLANTTASTAATISARPLTVSATAQGKVYDTTTNATVTISDDHLTGDDVITSFGAVGFADKNVGTGKTVNVDGIAITGGADAGNYSANTTAATTADITPATLTVSAAGIDKAYDGTAIASVTLSDNHLGSDVVTTGFATAVFADKNVGAGKGVSVDGIAISGGADAGNYTLANTTASTSASITQAALTVNAAGVSRVYDGTMAATVTLSDNHIGSDDVTTAYGAAAFADKNVGTSRPIGVTGIAITGGADAANYALANTTASTAADITTRPLAVSATALDKVYDATTNATVTLSNNHLGSDTVTLNFSAAFFADKNADTNKAVSVEGIAITGGTDAGNYSLTNATATAVANITPADLTVTATGVNKPYDGTTNATVTLSDNHIGTDVVTTTYATAGFEDKDMGTNKPVHVDGIAISGGDDATNYTLVNTTASTVADITGKVLVVTAVAADKVYDGTTAATVTISDNHIGADDVVVTYGTATFADKNAGTNKTVNVTGIAITGGADAASYTLADATTTASANITKATLTVSATGVDKVYDTTSNATVTLSDNHLGSDVITTSFGTAFFADKNVGVNKTLNVDGIAITGDDAGNYTANATAATTANITPAPLTVTASGVDKPYDATTAATVTLSDNHLGSDVVTTTFGTAAFVDKNAGPNKPIGVGGIGITGGADVGNYTLANTTAATTANITLATLTVSATAANKVYDGNTNATVTLSNNHIGSDDVTVAFGTAAFADKNVGSSKAVSVDGIALTAGTDAGNYTLANTTASASANITARPLAVSATALDKVYDATTNTTVALANNHLGSDDVMLIFATAAFADKNVGTNKVVSIDGIAMTGGADMGNYTLANTAATTAANITPADLVVTATGVNKPFDGNTNATVTLSDNHIGTDIVTTAYATAGFEDASVGTNKMVNVDGISITGGDDATNYALANTSTNTTADITPLALTVTVTAADKVYDGTANATVTLSDNHQGSDDVTVSFASATFADKNVGSNKVVTVSGLAITGGADAAHYTLVNTTAATAASITPATLTVTATAQGKVYDTTTNATVTLSDNHLDSDEVTVSFAAAAFADKNAGSGKTVNVTGVAITGGADAGNYTVSDTVATTASISKASLAVSAAASDKVYDATANASVTLSDNHLGSDSVTTSFASATFADKNVGASKPVSVDGIAISGGADAGNYSLANATASAMANITPATLTVNATAADKVYVGSSRVDLQACKLEYSIVSPK